MTDNEIVKALECCIDCDCTDCPCNTREGCKDIDYEAMLDLITRQKAEIENLELLNASLLESCERYSKACDVYKAEIERLQNDAAVSRKEAERFKSSYFVVGVRGGATHRLMKIIRLMEHDAIKEFAERLKHKATETHNTIPRHYRYVISNDFIDNLVKEMVGDDNENL